jgi:hypothetical protein
VQLARIDAAISGNQGARSYFVTCLSRSSVVPGLESVLLG